MKPNDTGGLHKRDSAWKPPPIVDIAYEPRDVLPENWAIPPVPHSNTPNTKCVLIDLISTASKRMRVGVALAVLCLIAVVLTYAYLKINQDSAKSNSTAESTTSKAVTMDDAESVALQHENIVKQNQKRVVHPADVVTEGKGDNPSATNSSNSTDGKYSVEIREVAGQGRLLLVMERGEHLFEEEAMGYLLGALWSPGGRYLALNERRANSGDYLWIFDLQSQKVLKRPDDPLWRQMESKGLAILQGEADKKWGSEAEDDRDWGTALRWKDESVLVAAVAVRFRGDAIISSESSVLKTEMDLSVGSERVELVEDSLPKESKVRSIGDGFLADSCFLEFNASTRELIFTFEWAARYGAWRETVRIDDLELSRATAGPVNSKGAFEGSFPLQIPQKSGAKMKLEKWNPTEEDFSWSASADRSEFATGPFVVMLRKEYLGSDERMEKFVSNLNLITQNTEVGNNGQPLISSIQSLNPSGNETERMKGLLIGKWLERKHVVFFPDGTWAAKRNDESPLDKTGRRWELVGDKLKWIYLDGIQVNTILSIDSKQMMLRDEAGNMLIYQRLSAASVTFQGEVHPETRLKLLGEFDVSGWSKEQFQYAINEMYARYGLYFKNEKTRLSFQQYVWYRPDPLLSMETIESRFSDIEAANLKFLGGERDRKIQQSPGNKYEGEIWPQTRTRIIAASEVNSWSKEQVQYAINEMFARYGLFFKSEATRAMFARFRWYRPDPSLNMVQIEGMFSEIEKANLKLLGEIRNRK